VELTSRHAVASLLLAAAACDGPPGEGAERIRQAIVYGADDRLEHFQISDPDARARVGRSVVALVRKSIIRRTLEGLTLNAPTWTEQDDLCEGEPFGDQTAAAFCSGILVDWDLVLTAGHCTRSLVPSAFAAVFGYYFAAPGKLGIGDDDIIDVARVVTATESEPDRRPRLDHAWLRLARPARPPLEPAPIRMALAGLRAGAPILFAGTSGGVPLKADRGATVANLGEPWGDYFVANTDSAQGSSGGGAFDADLALIGALERGGADFVRTEKGCWTTSRHADDRPQEEFTFAARALENLCRKAPDATSLCRRDCGDPCVALPLSPDAGCSLAPARANRTTPAFIPLVSISFLAIASAARARARRRPDAARFARCGAGLLWFWRNRIVVPAATDRKRPLAIHVGAVARKRLLGRGGASDESRCESWVRDHGGAVCRAVTVDGLRIHPDGQHLDRSDRPGVRPGQDGGPLHDQR
jgi:hypothetical protein